MNRKLLILAFFEGSAVMALELLSGMIVAPFFGSTVVSWAIVLAITLGGLAAGYYVGGKLSSKQKPLHILQVLMFLGAVFLFILPFWGPAVMVVTMDFGLETGLLSSLFLFLFPGLFVFGSSSPIIIQQLAKNNKQAGKATGLVFGVSTGGGIITTLLLGLYIIPVWGITYPSIIGGTLVLLLSIILLFNKRKLLATASIVLFSFIALKVIENKRPGSSDINLKVQHTSEGVLGQVKVIDFGWKVGNNFTQSRALLVNNTWQTAVSMETGISLLSYVYHLLPIIKEFPEDSEVLVVGLGGGGLLREIQAAGYSPDVVELDGRLPDLALQYFGFKPKGKVIVDDGRHYLNINEKTYDVVILDVFQGEVAPWQLLTLEAFQEVKRVLNANGLLAIEFFGNIKNAEESKALSAVVKTLGKVGFNIQIIDVAEREKLILASKGKPLNLEEVGFTGKYYEEKDISDLAQWLVSIDRLDTSRVPLLTDNLPVLEKMTLQSAKEWRQYQNQMFRDYFVEFGLSNIH